MGPIEKQFRDHPTMAKKPHFRRYSQSFAATVHEKEIVISGPSGLDPIKPGVLVTFNDEPGNIVYVNMACQKRREKEKKLYNQKTHYVFKRIAPKGPLNFTWHICNMPSFQHAAPNALQVALHDILHYQPASIHVCNVNFYLEEYNEGGRPPLWSILGHNPSMNLFFTRKLWAAGKFTASESVSRILEMDMLEYVQRLDEIYANCG